MYKEKYIKYKTKYLELKNELDSGPNIIQEGGAPPSLSFGKEKPPIVNAATKQATNVKAAADEAAADEAAADEAAADEAAADAAADKAAADKAAADKATADKAAVDKATADKAAVDKAAAGKAADKRDLESKDFKTILALKCPITNQLFINPVLANDSFVYERDAIIKHLEKNNNKSPIKEEITILILHEVLLIKDIIKAIQTVISPKSIDYIINTVSCPISHKLFKDPVLAEDGIVYERSAIRQLFTKIGPWTSPMTLEPIRSKRLMPIKLITDIIHAMIEDNLIPSRLYTG